MPMCEVGLLYPYTSMATTTPTTAASSIITTTPTTTPMTVLVLASNARGVTASTGVATCIVVDIRNVVTVSLATDVDLDVAAVEESYDDTVRDTIEAAVVEGTVIYMYI